MSETFATSRLPGPEDFERRRRSMGEPDVQLDPLAELARLVGQNDPFRGAATPQIRSTIAPADRLGAGADPRFARHDDFSDFDGAFRGAIDAGEEVGAPDDPAVVHPGLDGLPARSGERGFVPPRAPHPVPEVSADGWARGVPPVAPTIVAQEPGLPREDAQREGGSSKRTLIVLAAVVALTGGGLAASFLAKPTGSSTALASASTPTIMAASGPSKVQPAPVADAGSSEPSTLLDKNKSDGTATARVVNSVEQPVDLAQAVKPAAGTDNTAPASSFPEPRKVKTVLVRPDGTIISDRPASAADSAGLGAGADAPSNLAFDPKTSLPVVSSPPAGGNTAETASPPPPAPTPAAATPATGKSAARVPVTPRAAAGQTAVVTAGHPAGSTPTGKPVAPHAPAKPKPAEVADATPTAADTPTASLPNGKFAAQLGAGTSEADARDLSNRLSHKFSDLLGGKLSVHKAQSGDKTVFRVRVSGLSQDAAKALCGKVAAGGGGCFVARD